MKVKFKVGDIVRFANCKTDYKRFVVYGVPITTQINIAFLGDSWTDQRIIQYVDVDKLELVESSDFERFKSLFDSLGRKYEIRELPDYNLIQLMPEHTATTLEFRLSNGEYLK